MNFNPEFLICSSFHFSENNLKLQKDKAIPSNFLGNDLNVSISILLFNKKSTLCFSNTLASSFGIQVTLSSLILPKSFRRSFSLVSAPPSSEIHWNI